MSMIHKSTIFVLLLALVAPVSAQAERQVNYTIKVLVTANLREQPDANSRKVTTVFPGTELDVVAEKANWLKVYTGHTYAWMAGWLRHEVLGHTDAAGTAEYLAILTDLLLASEHIFDLLPACDPDTLADYRLQTGHEIIAILETLTEVAIPFAEIPHTYILSKYTIGATSLLTDNPQAAKHVPPCREAVEIYTEAQHVISEHMLARILLELGHRTAGETLIEIVRIRLTNTFVTK